MKMLNNNKTLKISMKSTLSIISIFLISASSFCQQIGDGLAPILTDFTVPLRSGLYNGLNPIGAIPDNSFGGWQHLILVRHPNLNNDHQLQLASSFTINDRLFFRKIAGGLESINPTWIELATRGANTFIGNQSIVGNQNIFGNLFVGADTEIATISGPTNCGAIQIKSHSGLGGSQNRYLRLGWKDNNSVFSPALSINDDLNVGIGSTNPDSKLTVKGKIHAEEVKIDLAVPADYVFEKYYLGQSSLKPDYTLLTLSEVEKFTQANHHLPNVPSAKEIKENGLLLGKMSNVLLQKIEELTLYSIEQQKTIDKQAIAIERLEKENQSFKKLEERLNKIEKELETKK
jgi:hypothetical protein